MTVQIEDEEPLACMRHISRWQRLLWALGYDRVRGGAQALWDWSIEDTPDFAAGALMTDVVVRLSFTDRLRVLLTGWLHVQQHTKTDVIVNRAESRSTVRVCWRDPR